MPRWIVTLPFTATTLYPSVSPLGSGQTVRVAFTLPTWTNKSRRLRMRLRFQTYSQSPFATYSPNTTEHVATAAYTQVSTYTLAASQLWNATSTPLTTFGPSPGSAYLTAGLPTSGFNLPVNHARHAVGLFSATGADTTELLQPLSPVYETTAEFDNPLFESSAQAYAVFLATVEFSTSAVNFFGSIEVESLD